MLGPLRTRTTTSAATKTALLVTLLAATPIPITAAARPRGLARPITPFQAIGALPAGAHAFSTMSHNEQQQQHVNTATGGGEQPEGQNTGAGVQLDEKSSRLIEDAKLLFGAKPTHEIFERSWAKDAIFEDPIAYARGWREYSAQWWGMPAAFKQSETLSWKPVKVTPEEIQYEQKQLYVVKGLGTKKEMDSLVVMKLNSEGKITHFEDRWNGKPINSGSIGMALRRANARTLPYLVTVPKDDASNPIAQQQKNDGKSEL